MSSQEQEEIPSQPNLPQDQDEKLPCAKEKQLVQENNSSPEPFVEENKESLEQPKKQRKNKKRGSKEEVYNGLAECTAGGLMKGDLILNKKGKVVSKKKSEHGLKAFQHITHHKQRLQIVNDLPPKEKKASNKIKPKEEEEEEEEPEVKNEAQPLKPQPIKEEKQEVKYDEDGLIIPPRKGPKNLAAKNKRAKKPM